MSDQMPVWGSDAVAAPRAPWPDEWSPSRRSSGLASTVLFALMTAGGIAAATSGFGDPRVIIFAAGIPLFAGLTVLVIYTRLRVRSRSTAGFCTASPANGVTAALSVSFQLPVCVAAWLIAIGTTLLGAAIATASLVAAFSGSSVGVGALLIGLIVAVIALYVLGVVVECLIGRLSRGMLLLSPAAITYRGWGSDMTLAWNEIASVEPMPSTTLQIIAISCYGNTGPQYRYHSLFWKPLKKSVRVIAFIPVNGTLLAADPALALNTVRFYYRNPSARAELGTDAAVQRVRSGAVITA